MARPSAATRIEAAGVLRAIVAALPASATMAAYLAGVADGLDPADSSRLVGR